MSEVVTTDEHNDSLTVECPKTRISSPEELLARATQLGRVIVTCDDDFLVLAEDWLDAGKTFAGVVYGHQLRLTIGRTIRDLELVAGASTAEELRDQIVFLPL